MFSMTARSSGLVLAKGLFRPFSLRDVGKRHGNLTGSRAEGDDVVISAQGGVEIFPAQGTRP